MAKRTRSDGFTHRQIAEDLEISEATVSRVLSGRLSRDSSTARRIADWFEKHGLSLPLPHRQVLLILPDAKNRFFTEMADQFARALRRWGVLLAVAYSDERPEEEERVYEFYSQFGLDGVIYVPAVAERQIVDRILDDGIPLVVLDRKSRDELVTVSVDNESGVRDAVLSLNELGHQKIGFVKGPVLLSSAEDRFKGYLESMDTLGLKVDDEWIFHGDFSRHAGYEAGREFAQRGEYRRPTAVLCANDAMAIGFLLALQEMGVKVPAEVSLVGFDGTEDVRWVHPQLATVSQQIPQIVDSACSELNMLIQDPTYQPKEPTLIPPRFLPNASVSRPPE